MKERFAIMSRKTPKALWALVIWHEGTRESAEKSASITVEQMHWLGEKEYEIEILTEKDYDRGRWRKRSKVRSVEASVRPDSTGATGGIGPSVHDRVEEVRGRKLEEGHVVPPNLCGDDATLVGVVPGPEHRPGEWTTPPSSGGVECVYADALRDELSDS